MISCIRKILIYLFVILLAGCTIAEDDIVPSFDDDFFALEDKDTQSQPLKNQKANANPINFLTNDYLPAIKKQNLKKIKSAKKPKADHDNKDKHDKKNSSIGKSKASLQPADCFQKAFLVEEESISGLYEIFLKENKDCQVIDDREVALLFMKVLIFNYDKQTIRIVNADKKFLNLYVSAIRNSERQLQLVLNKKLMTDGCGLLSYKACMKIKMALD